MRTTKYWAALIGLILAVTSSSAHAGECGYAKCWGAVAFGHRDKISYSYGKWSKRAAFRDANKTCRGLCSEIHTFYNECAAVARGTDRKWALYKAQTRDLAQTEAKRACSAKSYDCKIVVWACSR